MLNAEMKDLITKAVISGIVAGGFVSLVLFGFAQRVLDDHSALLAEVKSGFADMRDKQTQVIYTEMRMIEANQTELNARMAETQIICRSGVKK